MTRLIRTEDIQDHFSMGACFDALEVMFEELGHSRAITNSREDTIAPPKNPPADATPPVYYKLKSMGGVVPELGVSAIRLNSYLLEWPFKGDTRVRTQIPAVDGQLVDLVLLFSTETTEPLAVFPSRIVNSYRVGATSALGAKYLACEDADTLALLGAGWQARAHLIAIANVRDLEAVAVYSPTRESRDAFVEEMQPRVSAAVHAVDDPREACENADILQTTTNSLSPVFELDWIKPGTHVGVIRDTEAPDEFFDPTNFEVLAQSWSPVTRLEEWGDQIETRTIPTKNVNAYIVEGDESVPRYANRDTDAKPLYDWKRLPSLGQVIVDDSVGRSSQGGLTGFYNRGMGVQFAAAGKALFDIAEEHDLGQTIPTELLTDFPRPDLPLNP